MTVAASNRRSDGAIASLPMYWMPQISSAVSAWWRGISRHMRNHGLVDVPSSLYVPEDLHTHWSDPELLFGQTCGGPLVNELGNCVRIVGTPAYASTDAEGHRYRSVILVREDFDATSLADLAGTRFAMNDHRSYSGCHAMRDILRSVAKPEEPFFSSIMVTGSHFLSMEAIKNGEADCAAIDGVSKAMAAHYMPSLCDGLRIIDRSQPVPGLPYITRAATPDSDLERIRLAIEDAFSDPDLADCRSAQLLDGFQRTDHQDYDEIKRVIAESAHVVL